MTNRTVALLYAKHGVRVFPCRETDQPSGPLKSPYINNGLHGASAVINDILKWWSFWPNAVVGLPCRLNGVIAIDADRHGREDGVEALSQLFSSNCFNPKHVPLIATPRNGVHCIFKRPSTLNETRAKLMAAIDVRDNAYIICAGSVLANGKSYELQNGSLEELAFAIGANRLPDMPAWLCPLITRPLLSIKIRHRIPDINSKNEHLESRIGGLIRAIVLAPSGSRNSILHWGACRVGEFVAVGGLQPATAMALLIEAGKQSGLPEREVVATVRSGLRNGYVGIASGR